MSLLHQMGGIGGRAGSPPDSSSGSGFASPLRIDSWPRAILHMDGDGFFASVEQALDPKLKGRPVVVGAERGIVTAASYEAKAKGVSRGVPLSEVRKLCPDCVFVPSHYEAYGIFSKKMFAILRDHSPLVEEYSIDEAFADLTGLRRLHRGSYKLIAETVKKEVERSLDITVSVGVSLTKSLAKLCSKFRKPSGLTVVPGRYVHLLLERTPLHKVWGFGKNSVAYLQKAGLKTALDFVNAPEEWARQKLGKTGHEMWKELRGDAVWPVDPSVHTSYQSLMRSRTFAPPTSTDPVFLLAQLLRNLETVSAKARRYELAAGCLRIFLKRQNFDYDARDIRLPRPTSALLELAPVAKALFENAFHTNVPYRATGVGLGEFRPAGVLQFGLFEDAAGVVKREESSLAVDAINDHYGRHTVHLGDTTEDQTEGFRKVDEPQGKRIFLR